MATSPALVPLDEAGLLICGKIGGAAPLNIGAPYNERNIAFHHTIPPPLLPIDFECDDVALIVADI